MGLKRNAAAHADHCDEGEPKLLARAEVGPRQKILQTSVSRRSNSGPSILYRIRLLAKDFREVHGVTHEGGVGGCYGRGHAFQVVVVPGCHRLAIPVGAPLCRYGKATIVESLKE